MLHSHSILDKPVQIAVIITIQSHYLAICMSIKGVFCICIITVFIDKIVVIPEVMRRQ